jgi:hypothetical protein
MKPFDTGLNTAIKHIASKLFPCGYDVADTAPETLDQLNAHIETTGRMVVWSGASDNTIYADAETNWAFRAWHDWCHWKAQLPCTLAGEIAALDMQIEHLKTLGLLTAFREAALRAEVEGGARLFEITGRFPDDPRRFALTWLKRHGVTHNDQGKPLAELVH